MQTHAIVELEEGALNLTVGANDGDKVRVLRSLRLPLPDLSRDGVTNALRTVGSDALQGVSAVHVVLGERRMQHFASTVPVLPAADTVAFVVREALRMSNLTNAADVLVATRLLGRSGGRNLLGTTALASAVWQPINTAFEAHGLEVLGLYSMESCLALAAPAGPEPVAVLEVNSGRARFVLTENRCPMQVRRFLIGGGAENNSSALMTQLAMELPRTLDWLREMGQKLPQQLLLGTRVALEPAERAMLVGDEITALVDAPIDLDIVDGQVTPSLAVLMLLHSFGRGERLPSLLDAPNVRLPWSTSRRVAIAAAAVAGIACSFRAFVDGSAWYEKRDTLAALQREEQQLDTRIDVENGVIPAPPAVTPDDGRLQAALALRRPASRLLADVSNSAEEGLLLDELKFASTDRVTVTGIVEGQSRKQALATMATFARRVHNLDYVLADGQDEIVEVAGQRNRFRFRVTLSWRNS